RLSSFPAAVLSVLGNAAVLVSAGRRLALLKAPELLTVNLAITDIGMALSMYPLSITSAFSHAWVGGDTSCLYYGLMGMIFSITSIMTLAVMGMVRYLVIGSPPKTGIKFQRRTISFVISGIWLYASLWALFPLLGWGSYGPEPFGLACSIDWTGYGESLNHSTFIITLSILCTFLPCLVIFFTYFGIAWKLHRAYQSIQSNDFQYGNVEKKITLVTTSREPSVDQLLPPYLSAGLRGPSVARGGTLRETGMAVVKRIDPPEAGGGDVKTKPRTFWWPTVEAKPGGNPRETDGGEPPLAAGNGESVQERCRRKEGRRKGLRLGGTGRLSLGGLSSVSGGTGTLKLRGTGALTGTLTGALRNAATRMAVMISVGFLIAWTPYVAVSFWSMLHSREQGRMTPFVTLLPCLFAKSSTVYNPFIYFIFQRTSQHKPLCLQRLTLCSSCRAAGSPAKGGKLEGKMVKGSECIFGNATDDSYMGLMGVTGSQRGGQHRFIRFFLCDSASSSSSPAQNGVTAYPLRRSREAEEQDEEEEDKEDEDPHPVHNIRKSFKHSTRPNPMAHQLGGQALLPLRTVHPHLCSCSELSPGAARVISPFLSDSCGCKSLPGQVVYLTESFSKMVQIFQSRPGSGPPPLVHPPPLEEVQEEVRISSPQDLPSLSLSAVLMDMYSSALSPALDICTGCYLLVVAVLSVVGNLLVIVMAVKRSSRMKPPELLSVNLAVTDLGAVVTMYPLAMASAWSHRWLGGEVTCTYYGLAGFFFGVASIMNLTVLAIVRFIVSFNLQSPREKISWKIVKALCMWIWLYALIWALFPILGWGRYGPEPFGLSCSLAWGEMKHEGFSFVISMFSFNLMIPTVVIVGCYFGITINLFFTYKKSVSNSSRVPNIIKLHRRLLIIAVLISVGFIGCWAPYGLVSLWSVLRDSSTIPPEVSLLPCMFAKSSTLYNPMIYYIFSQSFKREVKQLCWLCLGSNRCHVSNSINDNSVYMVSADMKPNATRSSLQEVTESQTVSLG
ncbi:hypothetical protein L3Q82_011311, partial [Scortum barcoo]